MVTHIRRLCLRSLGPRFFLGSQNRSFSSSHDSSSSLKNASIHRTAVILDNVEIKPGAVVGANCVIGPDCKIGEKSVVHAGCVIQYTAIGNNVVLHPGVCIGQEGFGWTIGEKDHIKKPQELNVVIHDDVEIGANTTIDRGSWRATEIGRGTKLDNLIQIGHNVQIGQHCLICAQTGIAGSTVVGNHVLIGGQVGIAQHLTIGDNVQIAGKSGIVKSIDNNSKVGGVPAVPIRQFHRQNIILAQAEKKRTDF